MYKAAKKCKLGGKSGLIADTSVSRIVGRIASVCDELVRRSQSVCRKVSADLREGLSQVVESIQSICRKD